MPAISEPISAAGLYVPGGKAAYPSSVLMNAIPAKVAGAWRLDNGRLALVQDHQRLQGTLSVGGKSQPITGSLRGNEITLTAGRVTYTGIVDGTTITGTVTSPTGEAPWRARR